MLGFFNICRQVSGLRVIEFFIIKIKLKLKKKNHELGLLYWSHLQQKDKDKCPSDAQSKNPKCRVMLQGRVQARRVGGAPSKAPSNGKFVFLKE